jgi:hypothetical protein
VQDSNVLRAIGLVLGLIGFSALLWIGPSKLRWTNALLLGALLAGNVPQLAKPYISVPPSLENFSSAISLVLAVAGTIAVGVQLLRARQHPHGGRLSR